MLLLWNKTHNLSGIKDLAGFYENILDAIYPLKFICDFDSCLDIGSGAGFPALALAICRPLSAFILVEPRLKRAGFLHQVVLSLGLEHIVVKKSLIEHLELAQDQKVALITSRAVMGCGELIAEGRKFLKKNGYYLFYKGSHLDQEIAFAPDECVYRGNRAYFYRKDR
ncbi:16S rRNA (guanine(527)-N(7))-methyltransferase RsmG [Helicobacter sp. 12S02634-8]|nr:16S rRNA (guanine(527)-N(7))-methyltransferase RsmG [Helicobacter sp. 12S02634-8]